MTCKMYFKRIPCIIMTFGRRLKALTTLPEHYFTTPKVVYSVFLGSHYGRGYLNGPVSLGVSTCDPSGIEPPHPPPGDRSSPKFCVSIVRPAGGVCVQKHFNFE